MRDHMDPRRKAIRKILANSYQSPGFGFGGYGGGKRYRPRRAPNLRSGKPIEIYFRRQRLERKRREQPEGVYVVWVKPEEAEGRVRLKRPLIVPWGPDLLKGQWVDYLKEMFPNATHGRTLTRAIKRERYDSIITVRGAKQGATYQIVLFDDVGAEYLESSLKAEEVFNRYFQEPSYARKKSPPPRVFSSQLGGFASEQLYEEELERYREDLEYLNQQVAEIDEALEPLFESYNEWQSITRTVESLENLFLDSDLYLPPEQRQLLGLGSKDDVLEEIADLIEILKTNPKVQDEFSMSESGLETFIRGNFINFLSKVRDATEEALADAQDQAMGIVDPSYYDSLKDQIENRKERIQLVEDEAADFAEDMRKFAEKQEAELKEKLEVMKLSGVYGLPQSENYTVSIEKKQSVRFGAYFNVWVSGPYIHYFNRTIYPEQGEIYNSHLKLEPGAPDGLGTRILYSQALAAKAQGYEKITCEAAGDYHDSYSGYYIWPRLGYQGADRLDNKILKAFARMSGYDFGPRRGLTKIHREDGEILFKRMVDEGFFPDYPLSYDEFKISDLMMTEKGRDLWKKYGKYFDAAFSLEDEADGTPSRSMQILSSYVRLKEKARGKKIDKWAVYADDLKGAPELELTPQDERLLDIAWDQLRRRETKKRLFRG